LRLRHGLRSVHSRSRSYVALLLRLLSVLHLLLILHLLILLLLLLRRCVATKALHHAREHLRKALANVGKLLNLRHVLLQLRHVLLHMGQKVLQPLKEVLLRFTL